MIGSGVGVIGAAVMALMVRYPGSTLSLADPIATLVDQTSS